MLHSLILRFRNTPVQSTLLSFVVFCHLIFLLLMFFSPQFATRKKSHKPLIVKTIVQTPAPKTKTLTQKPPVRGQQVAKKLEPKKEIPPPPKPPAVKKEMAKPAKPMPKEPAIADKTIAKKPTPVKKTPTPERAKISDDLLKQLQESIAKIETKGDKEVANLRTANRKTTAPIQLQIDHIEADEKGSYTDMLVDHLHQSLRLPDYGEVKIQLSLHQDGSVAKLVVLNAQSEKNKRYLESTLPRLKFPRFEDVYANKKEYTFTLTFCNE